MVPGTKRRRVTKAPEARREDILAAGLAVFREKGVKGATVGDVTAAAGVAKGTFYLYFRSKDELGAALRERFALEMLQAAEEMLAGLDADDWEGRVDALARSVIRFQLERRDLAELVFHGLPRPEGGDVVAESERRVLELFAGAVERGAAEGRFAVDDPQMTATLLFHAIHGVLHDLAHGGGREERLTAAASQLLRRALGAKGAGGR
jgi:AcrR family transcriptional regulator